MIKIKNLTVEKNNIKILDDLNLTLSKNEKILISGKSGTGKTTLLKTILFYDVKTAGKIYFYDEEISKKNINEFRNKVTYIGQKPPAFNGNVNEFLSIPYDFKSNNKNAPSEVVINNLLIKLSFDVKVLEKNFNSLSGGEQQRITIIQSLLLNKNIFLLDEITSSLDKENIRNVVNLFRREKKTLLVVSHNSEWENLADKIYLMKNGKLILAGN